MIPEMIGAAVGAVLSDLDVDDATINRILGNLESGSDDVKVKSFKATPPEAFGNLDGGTEMALHTTNAHDFMTESMVEMLKTLGFYSQGVEIFRQKVKNADEVSAQDLNRYHRAVQNAESVNGRQNPDYNPYDNGGK